ncbi:MAG: lipopolysaccharide assembly protein LapA domain-containing protein [Calditrichaceae bacterium]|jgi:uncharacterized integral membrane protein
MRIVGIFLWIIFGAIVLWFFTLNLDQTVDIDLFSREFADVNLVSVIFISIFFGVALGALLLLSQFLKTRSQLSQLKKEYNRLLKESEIMQKVSIPKAPAINSQEKEEEKNEPPPPED